MNDVSNAYFEWLCGLIRHGCPAPRSTAYKKLLIFLHDTSFRYSIPRDGNRYDDGLNLRYQFSKADNIPYAMVTEELGGKACSVLEMMIALSARCENQIMADSDFGDRTGVWFWNMVDSLGLTDMTNKNYDEGYCRFVVERFLDREYSADGEGGLFRMHVVDENMQALDLRNYEIWYQATWYLNSVLEGEKK